MWAASVICNLDKGSGSWGERAATLGVCADGLVRIRRHFRDTDYVGSVFRLFDDRPMYCQLCVTERCNLDCSYCCEYDNTRPVPPLADLKRWARKARELGTANIGLTGGEPLTHPDIVALVRFCRDLGFFVSMSTNGFLLNERLVDELERAGLRTLQLSVDRMSPGPNSRKALNTLLPKLRLFDGSSIKLRLNGTVCADNLSECRQVLDYGLMHNLPTELRLVHADRKRMMRVDPGERKALRTLLKSMAARKAGGERIHSTHTLLDYQLRALDGPPFEWTCAGGYKTFYVSALGYFAECSMRPALVPIMEVTREMMRPYLRQKRCQAGCGVYCTVNASVFYERPVRFVAAEVFPRLRQVAAEAFPRLRQVMGGF